MNEKQFDEHIRVMKEIRDELGFFPGVFKFVLFILFVALGISLLMKG